MDSYDREFMRLKRFAPSLVDTEEKMIDKFCILENGPRTPRAPQNGLNVKNKKHKWV